MCSAIFDWATGSPNIYPFFFPVRKKYGKHFSRFAFCTISNRMTFLCAVLDKCRDKDGSIDVDCVNLERPPGRLVVVST